jgi:hypothetical protein
MKNIIILLMSVILLASLASAEIIITQPLKENYNLGDTIFIPITITSPTEVSGSLQMDLICNGHQINFYKNGVTVIAGGEEKREPYLVLIKEEIGEVKGECKIKAIFRGEYTLTNDFIISDLINIQSTLEKTEFSPGENILIKGGAIKDNGNDVNGIIELEIISDNSSININQLDTIKNGFFSINVLLSEDMKAGNYLIKLIAYEEEMTLEGEIIKTNNGFVNHNILIKQVPISLEIVFENPEVEPGTNLKVKAILHDQTGEKIESNAIISIKDEENKILEQVEKPTDEFLEFPIVYNELPKEWSVVAVSNKIMGESTFRIKEKEEVKIELINKTIGITNIGNVFYNKIVLVKIENKSLNINVSLEVDETQKYILTAPNGEYKVDIITDKGNLITGMVTLTGDTIDVKKASGVMTLVKYPLVWIFIIAILGFITFMIFKKGYKKSFFGYIRSKKREKSNIIPIKKDSIIHTKNKAELCLSLKGDKQNVSVVCLKLKNFHELKLKKENIGDTLQKIVDIAEESKAIVYENQDNLLFILAPTKTKTFKNEKTALEIAQKIREALIKHNKLFKQKIEFGISLNYGAIIAKQEKESLKFMSMGTLMSTAKKISSLSEEEVLLSEKINEKLLYKARTQKHNKKGITVYTIKEMKHNREGNKKFIKDFLKRIEKK